MDKRERFVRWQRITREQFSAVSNLVLGLATGLVAFQVSALTATPPIVEGRRLAVAALLLLAASVALGLWCAWNRLQDFRQTAQRARNILDHVDETGALGTRSWLLLQSQLIFFLLGALLVGARVIF